MQVAVDPAGDAVFVWGRRSGAAHGDFEVQTRTRYANGSLSPIQTLSKPSDGLMRPQVAVDSGGDAVFIWRRNDQSTQEMRVEARTRSANGTLSPIKELSPAEPGVLNPCVAMNARGAAFLAWNTYRSNGSMQAASGRALTPNGTFSSIQPLGPSSAYLQDLGIDDHGDTILAFWGGSGDDEVAQMRVRSPSGALGPLRTLSAPAPTETVRGAMPKVAVAPDGAAAFVWSEYDLLPSGLPRRGDRILSRFRTASGTLGPIGTLAEIHPAPSQQIATYGDENVAINSTEKAIFTFSGPSDPAASYAPNPDEVFARTRSPSGALGGLQRVAHAPFADQVVAGIDDVGSAVIAWSSFDQTSVIGSRTRSADGSLSRLQTLSSPGESSMHPAVALTPNGKAVVAWQGDGQAQAAFGP